jgi:hypothetical protein
MIVKVKSRLQWASVTAQCSVGVYVLLLAELLLAILLLIVSLLIEKHALVLISHI